MLEDGHEPVHVRARLVHKGRFSAEMSLKFPMGVNSVMPGASRMVTWMYSFSRCCCCAPCVAAAAAGEELGGAPEVGVVGEETEAENVEISPKGG